MRLCLVLHVKVLLAEVLTPPLWPGRVPDECGHLSRRRGRAADASQSASAARAARLQLQSWIRGFDGALVHHRSPAMHHRGRYTVFGEPQEVPRLEHRRGRGSTDMGKRTEAPK